jgi:hypothetical protein
LDKVLLLNPPGDKLYQRDLYCSNVSKANYYWPSIDLLIQSGILGQEYQVDILDAIVEKLSPVECLARIREGRYRAVLFLTGTASWQQDFAFLSQIKHGASSPLLIGNGDILLYKAEEFMNRYPFLDAVLLDYTTEDVLHFLESRFSELSALAFREDRGIFKCSFCIASTLGYKYRSVDNVLEELRRIVSLGIKEVFFMDFTFEARRRNALELSQRMVEERLDLTWVCSSRAGTLDVELLTWMKNAGCHTLLLGVESGDEELLKEYSKGVTKDQMRKAFSLCRKLGIRTLGHFIIGLPGETEETVRKTVDFAQELDCDIASFNIAVPVLGTPLRERALAQGYLAEEELVFDSSDAYPVMMTPQFSKEQAWKWRKRAIRRFYFRPGYLWRLATQARSLYQWKLLVLNGLALVRNLFRGPRG